MAATFRQVVNTVLQNIGEAQIPALNTTVTDRYQLQVCNFVNHIKEDIESCNTWRALWQTFTMSYVALNTTQQIVDQGGFFLPIGAAPNSGASVVRMHNPKMGREVALVFDITTFGIPFPLDEMPLPDIIYYNTVLNQTPVAYSTNFCVQDLGNDVVNLIMYPGANTTRNIQLTLCNPQPRIDPTVAGAATYPWNGIMGLDTPILIPNSPLEIGSTWWCYEERGEELGANSAFTEDRYKRLLDEAIERDLGDQGGITMIVA